jgi:hypothetical protein
MSVLLWLQESAIAVWVGGADTIWAYPTILTLHTVGLGIVVGANVIVNVRLLGGASRVPLAALRGVYRPMWAGFVLNAVTGALLFVAGAEFIGVKRLFYLKLALIAAALVMAVRIKRAVFVGGGEPMVPPRARALAMVSLALWAAAIVAGRYTAYV